MRLARLALLLLCLALAVQATPSFALRKGVSGGGGGKPSGGGGSKPAGGSGGGSKPPAGGGSKPGGSSSTGSTSKPAGSSSYGDRPPSYASLYPDRSGVNAGGRGTGAGDSSRPYGPPPAYTANAQYSSVNYGQRVPTNTFASNAPIVYYASPSRTVYPGAWGYGYYPIFPYPWWAYGGGMWVGASYHSSSYNNGLTSYNTEFRNITVVNATNIPLIDNFNLFNTTSNITLTDFNNGTIQISPCGNSTSDKLQVPTTDCDFIVLNLRNGTVVAGNARSSVQSEITFFNLTLGNTTATLRTQTISNTATSSRGGVIAGIVIGCVVFVAIVAGACWWFIRRRRMRR